MNPQTVLVLGGGPDAEREVSLDSSRAVTEALRTGGRFAVEFHEIGRTTRADLAALDGDVIFPVLHGPWGEGGPLQDLLVRDGRPFVGVGPAPARLAMDKVATKTMAAMAGVPVTPTAVFNPDDAGCPLPLPVACKPMHEGSSVGLRLVRAGGCGAAAARAMVEDLAEHPARIYMIEPLIDGVELTVGIVCARPLPIIRIEPASGVYDYQAKYHRDDTRYTVHPSLPPGCAEAVTEAAMRIAGALGATELARVDFLLDRAGRPWPLEVNTMPGFTSHSLLPMAARAVGLSMTGLCERLVESALVRARNPAPTVS
ncbi:MAG: D-alanine--D-alanine ligase [Phycisphaerales bacterium JB039]